MKSSQLRWHVVWGRQHSPVLQQPDAGKLVTKFNPNHVPAGVPEGGQFASNFATWFGNSKTVDADGNPVRMYHGTRFVGGFDEFKNVTGAYAVQAGSLNAIGSWFTDEPDTADVFAAAGNLKTNLDSFPNGHVMPVYLSIQHPFHVYDGEQLTALWIQHSGSDARGFNGDPEKFRSWLRGQASMA